MNSIPKNALSFISTLIILTGFLSVSAQYPDVVNVGLFYGKAIRNAVITSLTGGYYVYGDGQEIYDLRAGEVLHVFLIEDSLHTNSYNGKIGVYKEIRLYKKSWGNTFQIKPIEKAYSPRTYTGNLFVRTGKNHLIFINNVYLEQYLAGAVETEAGRKCNREYYKVQAIICRTFTLAHLDRHLSEGFNLCDGVHCQAYHGRCTNNPEIREATSDTKNMVLVDSDIRLITAAYHSNCGGHTANSEDVWKEKLPYLRGRRDTFCLHMPNAHWQREINKKQWLLYLEKELRYPINDSIHFHSAIYNTSQHREKYLSNADSSVLFTRIRTDWKFPSALFTIEDKGDHLLFKGRGYGHGVGLCQEGAMHMSELGYNYRDILHFYYKSVHLIDLSAIDFFRDE